MFWNYGYLGESRETPIAVYEISRNVFEESLGKPIFNVLDTDLLTSMSINKNLSGILKRHYNWLYNKDHLMRNEYLCFKKSL